MEDDNKFQIMGENGEMIDCEIIFTYESEETGKNYIVYTDNSVDDKGNTMLFASIYDPTVDNPELKPIETEEEWDLIDSVLESILDEDDE